MSRSTGSRIFRPGLLWMVKKFISRIMSNMCRICIFCENVVEPTEKRKILFCHSMGGAIGVRYLEEFPLTFDAAILSAPMLGMNTGKYPKWLAKVTADFFLRDRKGNEICSPDRVAFQTNHPLKQATAFPENDTCISANMRLRNINYQTYGGTYAWVKAGFKVTRKSAEKEKTLTV